MQQLVKEFTKGLWTELPPFRLVLGLCPTLAVTKTADNGLGMGLAVIFVLVLSNMLISLVRDIIPKKVRIVCFIAISASLVVAVELLMQAYAYPLYQQLGIFVPLIVVNCIILGRAEAFAAKNTVPLAIADGLIILVLISLVQVRMSKKRLRRKEKRYEYNKKCNSLKKYSNK